MDIELIIALSCICFLGLPHGALDPVVAYRHRLFTSISGGIAFHCVYLLIALLGLGVWRTAPSLSLYIFLLYSAFHFGKDWAEALPFGGLGYGLLVLGAPSLFHANDIQTIFEMITFGEVHTWGTKVLQVMFLLGMICLVPTRSTLQSRLWLELIILFSLAIYLSPLWYFITYFCILHSPKHLKKELQSLSPTVKRWAVWVMALITLATVVLGIVLSGQLDHTHYLWESTAYQLIFVGLATLTIPHMLLMAWIEHSGPQYHSYFESS